MEERLDQVDNNMETNSILSDISKLAEQLLFTWGDLKEQAQKMSVKPFEVIKQQTLLDQMISDAKHTDYMLLNLRRAIKAL